jgi:signal transduction histidine kinase
MFLKTIKNLRGQIGVHLTLWYSGVFVASCLALFSVAFFLMQTYLVGQDKDSIQNRVKEYQSRFISDGFDEMMKEVNEEAKMVGTEFFFVRVADFDNKTIFTNKKILSSRYDLSILEEHSYVPENKWIRIRKTDDEDELDIFTVRLPDEHILQVGKTSAQRNVPLERFFALAAIVAGPIIIIGFAGGMFLSFRTLRPIRRLIGTVKSIKETQYYSARVPVKGTADELDELGSLFNSMLADIERLVAGMKEALDNVAHDLRTPMTRLRNTAEAALQTDSPKETYREALSDCLEQSEEAIAILKMLMDISEAETGTLKLTLEPLDASKIVEDAIDLYHHVAEEKNIVIRTALDPNLSFSADRSRIRQSLANLLDNALKYTNAGGHVEIRTFEKNGHAVIEVEDSGIGISPDQIPHIWDRLYRGHRQLNLPGWGLGLSLVKAIVHAHKGRVSVHSEPGKGSVFTLSFPISK